MNNVKVKCSFFIHRINPLVFHWFIVAVETVGVFVVIVPRTRTHVVLMQTSIADRNGIVNGQHRATGAAHIELTTGFIKVWAAASFVSTTRVIFTSHKSDSIGLGVERQASIAS